MKKPTQIQAMMMSYLLGTMGWRELTTTLLTLELIADSKEHIEVNEVLLSLQGMAEFVLTYVQNKRDAVDTMKRFSRIWLERATHYEQKWEVIP